MKKQPFSKEVLSEYLLALDLARKTTHEEFLETFKQVEAMRLYSQCIYFSTLLYRDKIFSENNLYIQWTKKINKDIL
jgi:hypothetical protein